MASSVSISGPYSIFAIFQRDHGLKAVTAMKINAGQVGIVVLERDLQSVR
jgi:hypothetical protein